MNEKRNGCAIYAPGGIGAPNNPFGKDVANLGLYRALAAHGGFSDLCFLSNDRLDAQSVAHILGVHTMAPPQAPRISTGSILSVQRARDAGTLLRGKADLADLAWLRRRCAADDDYSLVGLVHTIAPPAIRQYIAQAAVSPVQTWDALICTSPAVRDALQRMFDTWGEFLAGRFGGPAAGGLPMPQLPLLPLGVDAAALAAAAERPGAREQVRQALHVGEGEVLVLWVGRLSFFEKAFPQPMFKAVQLAAERSGVRLHFAMAGWFPNGAQDRERYEAAARFHAPSIAVRFLDGNDKALVNMLWAGADMFLSLVDNIQETFGIAPLEAMAAGLPAVVSDWDGYRATVRHGQQGFLIETLGGSPGLGDTMLDRHLFGMDSYQSYVGQLAQHTAVHIGRAADAIAALALDPDLRRRMGQAGKELVRTTFDWPVVVAQLRALFADLAERRRSCGSFDADPRLAQHGDPVRSEPFDAFALFATDVLDSAVSLQAVPGATPARLAAASNVGLNAYASIWRGTSEEAIRVIDLLQSRPGLRLGDVLDTFPPDRRKPMQATIMWLVKLGFVEWTPMQDLAVRQTETF